jgi:hypothetical protein
MVVCNFPRNLRQFIVNRLDHVRNARDQLKDICYPSSPGSLSTSIVILRPVSVIPSSSLDTSLTELLILTSSRRIECNSPLERRCAKYP